MASSHLSPHKAASKEAAFFLPQYKIQGFDASQTL
jgi:hypothetical protein